MTVNMRMDLPYERQLAHLNFIEVSVKIRKSDKILFWVLTMGVYN